MSSGVTREPIQNNLSFWDEEEDFINIKTPNALSEGEQARLILARRDAYQRLKQKTLNKLVFEMFNHKDRYTQYSGSIISFLHDFNKIFTDDIFVRRNEGHLKVLITEFGASMSAFSRFLKNNEII